LDTGLVTEPNFVEASVEELSFAFACDTYEIVFEISSPLNSSSSFFSSSSISVYGASDIVSSGSSIDIYGNSY